MRKFGLFAITLASFAFFGPEAQGQFAPPTLPPQLWTIVEEEGLGDNVDDVVSRGLDTRKPATKTNISQLFYTPSTSRSKANLQNFVNKTRAVDPAGAAQLEQLFASENVIQSIGSGMRSVGLDKNNAADAFALYWVNAWSAAYADFRPTSAATAKAVARQAAAGLSQSPEFAKATNAQKQEMAEALMIQGALIESAMQAAKNDPAMLRKVGQAVMKGAKASGLDLDKMTLTEQGFVASKKGSDAGAAIDAADPTAGDTALASADGAVQDGEGLSKTQLALIAGVAGAGIASLFFLGRASGRRG